MWCGAAILLALPPVTGAESTFQMSEGAGYPYSCPLGLSAASGMCLASLSQMRWDQTTEQLDGCHVTLRPHLCHLFRPQSAMRGVRLVI